MSRKPRRFADIRSQSVEGRTFGREQLGLFAEAPPTPPRGRLAERLEREHAEAAAIAAKLPPGVRFGTSSWSFPGWEGIVYSRRLGTAALAREGLREYARHPLLTTVGIDRGFYAPIPAADLRRYASQLPPGFLCCAKAPQAVTAAVLPDGRGPNPDFLEPAKFLEEMVLPFGEAFREHTGPFLLQFPPAPPERRLPARLFAQRLGSFLAALPGDLQYAIELRDPSLLTTDYRDVLAAHGAAHVYNYTTTMPMPREQASSVPVSTVAFAMIRLLLKPGTFYRERGEAFKPFDRVLEPDPEMRRQVLALIRDAMATGRPVSVLVNNKAEGCAPATIRALAELLALEVTG